MVRTMANASAKPARSRMAALAVAVLLGLSAGPATAAGGQGGTATVGDITMNLSDTNFRADVQGTIVLAGKVFVGHAQIGDLHGPPNWSFDPSTSTGTIGPVHMEQAAVAGVSLGLVLPKLSGTCTGTFTGQYDAGKQPKSLALTCSGSVAGATTGTRGFSVRFYSWSTSTCRCEPFKTYHSEGVYTG
jgi:hypothetical protein